jgi:hypothetical protein
MSYAKLEMKRIVKVVISHQINVLVAMKDILFLRMMKSKKNVKSVQLKIVKNAMEQYLLIYVLLV